MQQHPFIFSSERRYRLMRHISFWAFWWLFQSFLYAFSATSLPYYVLRLPGSMIESLLYLTCHIFLTYSLMYFVIPRYLVKGKYSATAIWIMFLFLLTATFSSLIAIYLLDDVRDFFYPQKYWFIFYRTSHGSFFLSLLAGLRGAITIGGVGASIKLMKYWYVKEQRNMQLLKENVESQLQLLKAQIHPHFLFNTLNNIYSYTQNTSPVASRLVMGLSDMLRYMLYECNQPLVPLIKDLKMLQDYIILEKIRYDNRLDVNLDLPDDVTGLYIAPLLLIPFVENCFKHGSSRMLEQPWISLTITIDGNKIKMNLVNGKPPANSNSNNLKQGIGIQNVRKRLELLYPGKHELVITDEEDVFIVNLKLEIERKEPAKNSIGKVNKITAHA